jgi:hypothetical protein
MFIPLLRNNLRGRCSNKVKPQYLRLFPQTFDNLLLVALLVVVDPWVVIGSTRTPESIEEAS